MFKYNTDTNELIDLKETTFAKNNVLEREHIEEWIRKNPDILGEPLLIIGHEYDSFETNDRLDLLAIDKLGKLVIIELKRDNSGSHVEFQCLKYCSYCSRLTAKDVFEIYSEYLRKHGIEDEPYNVIADFLELAQDDEDRMNEILNNSQRFIIIGREIDKRILSVCAWLHENGIEVKCLSIKPFINERSEIYIDLNQIIPPFKIEDYYVQKKETSERKDIHQPQYILDFFHAIVEKVNASTNFKVYYSPRKAYCIIRTGTNIEFALRYFKRDKSFSIHALTKNAGLKDKMKTFYEEHQAEIAKKVGDEVQFQDQGERNPNWCYIRVLIKPDPDKSLINMAPKMAGKFSTFCNYIYEKW